MIGGWKKWLTLLAIFMAHYQYQPPSPSPRRLSLYPPLPAHHTINPPKNYLILAGKIVENLHKHVLAYRLPHKFRSGAFLKVNCALHSLMV